MKHQDQLIRLKLAKGQIEGIIQMINDGRYCIEIVDQLSATISLLKNAQANILTNHLGSCLNGDEDKLAEVNKILKKAL